MDELRGLLARLWDWLNYGIAGSSFTIGKLVLIVALVTALIWVTGRLTRMTVERVVARRAMDAGVVQAVGAIFRYAVVALGRWSSSKARAST